MAKEDEDPSVYLENVVFPILLPGIEETLRVAKKTERRKRFNPMDYLSSYLYRHNPSKTGRLDVSFEEIPFVKDEWALRPRPPLPLSARLTEEEAATIIQAYYRGYRVRCLPPIQQFREWRKGYWEEVEAITKIKQFWRKKSSVINKHSSP